MPGQTTFFLRRWPILLGLLMIAIGAGVWADYRRAAPPDAMAKATYVGGQACVECHQTEHQAWAGSHHDLAMELATDESVLGDFDDFTFERLGVTTRFFRDGDRYMVNTEGPDGEHHDYHVKYTFGYEPLQQYMVEFPDGRVQVLRVSWDTAKKEWFYVPPPDVTEERLLPDDPLHWTGVAQNWNTTCAECHSTNLQKNYDLATDTYHTTFSEIDVSCEECHGPGSLHIALANRNSLFWDRNHGYGLAKLKSLDSEPQIQTCAKCHSRRHGVHPEFRPGPHFNDSYEVTPLYAGLYHADGQIQDEVYVYGSFLQSKMHAKGVRCTDCHDPHSLKPKFEGNALCAQCHIPAQYDTPAHHHHVAGTPGASCVECHMPETTYMVVDPRRDHSIRIPRPDLSVQLGTPNACNKCHVKPDEDAQWAADAVEKWYGPNRRDDPHWAPAIAAGRAGEPEGEPLLTAAVRRETTPAIVQATAVELLGQYNTPSSNAVKEQALESFSPLVRLAAVRSISPETAAGMVETLAPLLTDPVRSVRIEAARRLAPLPEQAFTSQQFLDRKAGLEEFRTEQRMHSERAAAHNNLGELARVQGDPKTAAREFRIAMKLEPWLAGPRRYLAEVLSSSGGDPAEIRRLYDEEIPLLERDTELAPGNAALWYELGRLRVVTGQYGPAVEAFRQACELAPGDYRFRLMLALGLERLHEQTGERRHFDEAVESLRKLEELNPDSPDAKGILQRMIQTRRGQDGRSTRPDPEPESAGE
ncbi:Tetratricopeptide repeat protein [Posidoniimonas corsicana]|uniref:Tetratricopeptide repeat protein n=1 Tax=Posidoniimonas corsicana TaxID=1938618 RepID=A0A5C5VH58_9BACT|nr:tetratricopeptide repeat protein [Posidoniimonas corsicana]TWT37307.1 Tetratricopeptide repeat protein [Posidoniimonas corsicana]